MRVASCSCGQLKATITGEPGRISICHCYACQRRTGSVFGAQARFPRETVSFEGKSMEFVRVGDSGGVARFHFCPACGATVYYTIDGADDVIAIPVGVLADKDFPSPVFSVYEDRKHAWVEVPPGADRLA